MVTDINFFKMDDSLLFKEITSKRDLTSFDPFDGYFIDADEKETRKILEFLKSSKNKFKIALKSRDETFNRRVIETLHFDYLVSPECNYGKDSLKQRSSGFNHVLAKEAHKKGIALLIPLDFLSKQDKNTKAILISRIIQNIKLCRKANCLFKIASFSKDDVFSEKDREFLGQSWGMSSQQINNSTIF